MDQILAFFEQNGLWLTLIAILGIVVLGILKYLNVFKKLDEKYRHVCYLAISVGLSIIGSCIYLACIHQFTFTYIMTLTGAIFALNQAFYAIYDTTTLKDLVSKLISWCTKNKDKIEEVVDSVKSEDQDKPQE